MNKEFINAIDDLVKEKGISKDVLIEAIESALVSAYKKNYGTSQQKIRDWFASRGNRKGCGCAGFSSVRICDGKAGAAGQTGEAAGT